MTPGNNGASTPEDDDPFGYLYADGQANGAQPPSGGYGYPNSVSRVRAVGTRQYGQQPQHAQTAPYGQVPQQASYSQPNAHYAAPETLPGGAQTAQQQMPSGGGGGGRGGRGPNTKGLLIGAIAVVAAVVVGIGVAMMGGDKDKDKASDEVGTSPTQSEESKPSPSSTKAGAAQKDLPEVDAKALRLSPGLTTASDFKGAKADGGVYVTGFNQVGAKVTWTVDGIEKAGSYRLYVRYGIPGVDANATLVVNGDTQDRPVNMKNFAGLPKGDWEKGWQETWSNVNLTKGTNTIEIACNEGNQCDAVLDQLWLKK
ncbi:MULTISPECIES: CBM35 domain-containing protein [Streptomyces]|uniref:CBM35 domain-containing protein n=1 Tax=Streptomyces indiaensis TaxID=284033 RepID=A0ABP5QLE3_9ACTN|nr:CBM35 domain-containing protein [Streptomyces indiaensis]MCF1645961.1 carbohydrate-binding protein [Streptomyces indiaensis]